VNVRLLDQSSTTNGVINQWRWWTDSGSFFTTDGSGTNLRITNANLNFAVNDTVMLAASGTLPTGLNSLSTAYYVKSVTTTAITLSLTPGGTAVTYTVGSGSGQFAAWMGSTLQNPILPLRNLSNGPVSVTLSVNDSGGSGWTTLTENNQIIVQTGDYAQPSKNSAYGNISLFVYERSTQALPKSTCICRGPTAACNLFFQNLWMEGAITKAGRATFDIVNGGNATANEIDLFESNSVGTYKNIAVVAGFDVIWSGKITVATKELKSQPGAAKQRAIYHCQADSDIYKLQDWNIATPATVTGQTPGQIVTDIVALQSGEPDFIGGYRGGAIDKSGLKMQMALTSTDQYTAFSQLMAAVDFDWRTRMETMVFLYATFDGSGTVTLTSAGLTAGALIGRWLLFPTTYCRIGGSSDQNRSGVLAWGQITANTATTITATLANAAAIPLANDTCLIVNIPRLDFSSDLREPTAVRVFTNNMDAVQFEDSTNKTNLFTKVTVQGQDAITGLMTSASIAAVTPFINAKSSFTNASYITYKTMGYVYSEDGTYLYLEGWNWALPISGDTYISVVFPNTGGIGGTSAKIAAVSQIVMGGQQVTKVTFTVPWVTPVSPGTIAFLSGYFPNYATGSYGLCIFVKSYADIGFAISGSNPTVKIGDDILTAAAGLGCGTNATYGDYIVLTMPTAAAIPVAHYPGCIVWNASAYSETSPATGSPVQIHGIINNNLAGAAGTSKSNFEVLACSTLIQGCDYYPQSTMIVGYYPFSVFRVRDGAQLTTYAFIREGQRITIVPYTGAIPVDRQVIIWDFDANTMQVSLTLGDYVHSVYNTIAKTLSATQNAVN
jgi:hypothetical protein